MIKKILIIQFLIFSSIFCNLLFCEDTTPQPYKTDEFPQGLQDLRRFEIITLGSLPFVTLDTTLAYSGIRYIQHGYDPAFKPDIFSKSSFSSDEQKGLILTSLGISVGIGLTDYIVRAIKRSNKRKKDNVHYEDINIYPISEDPEAVKIQLPETQENVEEVVE